MANTIRVKKKKDGDETPHQSIPQWEKTFYSIRRTNSPYRWELVRVIVNQDMQARLCAIEDNVPGIIKSRLLSSVLRDLDGEARPNSKS